MDENAIALRKGAIALVLPLLNMKPNFNEMSLKELRVYVLAHQNDNEAFYAYMDKSKTEENWVTMPPLNSMDDFDNYPEFLEKIAKDVRR
ncbi:DUF6887 family protein [Dendronalium sp. ChiSLP03b]|uniref:DUF6887 family protein n=1 Tax=Dendronalium sp. ChiSLP03b TaxID=3075381 RepID=UPI002AD4DB70|nr:hypothetical protein [Dendronalium sp. ChiSLP03b]MDZ8207637.1 hypothetical protein [Dendronalium sp. ChiSLP03b]